MVLVAIAVIGLPLLLDGSGSENRFRHVEQLREEPPRIVSPGGEAGAVEPSAKGGSSGSATASAVAPGTGASVRSTPSGHEREALDVREGLDAGERGGMAATGDVNREEREGAFAGDVEPLTAWVVQAGSFGAQRNAIEVRERLRAAGFPSFLTDTSVAVPAAAEPEARPMFRVQVGPMVDRLRAEAVRERVETLLGGEPIIVTYP